MHRPDGVAARLRPVPQLCTVASRVLDLVLPPESFDGGAERPQSPGYSATSWTRLVFLEDPVCDGCGLPYAYDVGARCPACEATPRAFARARAACLYDERSRDLILQLKHADRPELGRLFARWLSRAAQPLLAEADVVAPVPLHPRRLFARRYNQAAEIARPLAHMAQLRYLPDALRRRRATASQGGKSGRGRRVNVKGAFETTEAGRRRVAGCRVLLVDDVLTTGATAEACARALLQAGATAVDLAVVARVHDAAQTPI
jgi:ComF family protein